MARAITELILREDVSMELLLHQIENNGSKILLLLDGYDEATPEIKRVVHRLLLEKNLKVLLTSRPGGVEELSSYIDLKIENVGFSDQQIENYAQQYFLRGLTQKDHRPFLHAIRASNYFSDFARTPLYLQMLCCLWEKKKESFSSGLTDLYTQMIHQLLNWNTKKLKSFNKEEILSFLEEIAYKWLGQTAIPWEALEKICQSKGFAIEDLFSTGLLKQSSKESYTFLHASFQEYLAAKFLLSQGIDAQKEFITKHFPTHEMVILFLCGISSSSDPSLLFFLLETFSFSFEKEWSEEKFMFSTNCLNECAQNIQNLPQVGKYLEQSYSLWKKINGNLYPTPLFFAVQYGHTWLAESFCNKDPSIIGKYQDDGWTPLHFAAKAGRVEIAQWLCNKDPSIIGKYHKDDWTPLHMAASEGHIEMAKWLCEKDPSIIRKYQNKGRSPLYEAVSLGQVEMAQWLCNKDSSLIGKYQKDGWTYLHEAAAKGKVAMAEWLLKQDPSLLGKCRYDGTTPFCVAVQTGHLEMAEWLSEKDPSLIGKCDNNGNTALHTAAYEGHVKIAEWLYKKDPSLIGKYANNGCTPLHVAAGKGHIEMVKWLYKKDPSLIGKYMNDGCSVLQTAIYGGHVTIVQVLYKKDPSLIGKYANNGCTPLHIAVSKGHFFIVKWICSLDPAQLFVKFENLTPYRLAIKIDQQSIADWLLINFPKACKAEKCTVS